MINRSYLKEVAMIQSECEPRKKQPMISHYNKSPFRDRENRMNLANMGTPGRSNPKASLSPLRSRRTESTTASRVNFSKRRAEPMCINDPHKGAKYLTYSQQQTLYYCEKCAILLASQGFSVIKLNSNESLEINPRKEQVDAFLGELQAVMGSLANRQQNLNMTISNALHIYQEEEAKVEQYYNHFYQIIEQHKRRVIQQLKQEYEASIHPTSQIANRIEVAIKDSKRMKDDIIESMTIILHQSDEEQFRPIMDNYLTSLKNYKNMGNKSHIEPISMHRLDFKDPELACKALEEGLQVHWQKKGMESSKQSEVCDNPVQVIEVDEKFTKSSLKEIGNLFSSFDQ